MLLRRSVRECEDRLGNQIETQMILRFPDILVQQ